MSQSNEVFLGKKNSVARFNLTTKEAIWSVGIDGYPYILSCYSDRLLVQGTNFWGKYFHIMLNANTGEQVWATPNYYSTNAINCYITPHYYQGNIFFMNSKGYICKLCGDSGELLFQTKYKKWYESAYLITITDENIYLISKKKTFKVCEMSGECSEVHELARLSKDKITAAYGNGVDQVALFSVIAATAASSDGAAAAGGGDGGGGDGGG